MIQFASGSMRVRPGELFSLGDSSPLEPQSGGPYSGNVRRTALKVLKLPLEIKEMSRTASGSSGGGYPEDADDDIEVCRSYQVFS